VNLQLGLLERIPSSVPSTEVCLPLVDRGKTVRKCIFHRRKSPCDPVIENLPARITAAQFLAVGSKVRGRALRRNSQASPPLILPPFHHVPGKSVCDCTLGINRPACTAEAAQAEVLEGIRTAKEAHGFLGTMKANFADRARGRAAHPRGASAQSRPAGQPLRRLDGQSRPEVLLRDFLAKRVTWAEFGRRYRQELLESGGIDARNKTIKNHGQKFSCGSYRGWGGRATSR
jgi:hypothetical protein